MTPPTRFLTDLDRIRQARSQMASELAQITLTLTETESLNAQRSGGMGLSQLIEDLRTAENTLRQGVFRLMVLGDMKRGKSTFLNALIGEDLLPSAANPCTALLTVLRYGPTKQVIIHFTSGKTQTIDIETFKQRYTIDPAEAKRLATDQQLAFPEVSHAVVHYPLPLLEKGIEIVDSPGLNDTEARNERSLGYINSCHAILFLLKATQACTLAERRYLETYLKGRGLSIFFLINGWDQVKESLLDPDDEQEVSIAAAKLHRLFHTHLADYCQVDGSDRYDDRVFAVSALEALRHRLKQPDTSLENTNLREFIISLNQLLTQERAIAQFKPICGLARTAYHQFQVAVARRLPLLNQDVDELKARIQSVRPEFDELNAICDRFQADIRRMRDSKSQEIAQSLTTYLNQLTRTFETDFAPYQPELNLSEFISEPGRKAFSIRLKKSFERYINDQFHKWSKTAETSVEEAFVLLANSAQQYGASYQAVTDRMGEKLIGEAYIRVSQTQGTQASPAWAEWAAGFLSLSRGDMTGVTAAATRLDWQQLTVSLVTAGSLALVLGAVLGPVGIAIAGLGFSAMQVEQARKALTKTMKQSLVKQLPELARTHQSTVREAVVASFDRYEVQVMQRIVQDIRDRKAELENLVNQKESREIDRDAEVARLNENEESIKLASERIDSAYKEILPTTAYSEILEI